MTESTLLHELITTSAQRTPQAVALVHDVARMSYAELAQAQAQFAAGLMALGCQRGERVAIYLEKRFEAVLASFGTAAAGLVFVPVNPLLKPQQVAYILRDCGVCLLVTSPERLALLQEVLGTCAELRQIVLTGAAPATQAISAISASVPVTDWHSLLSTPGGRPGHRVIDADMAAILYTSGSTGSPKGVMLSHRNLVVGAKSVAAYLDNRADDTLLAVLPLSFDAGFSQLTTAFHVGARVLLLNYLMPRDVLKALAQESVTGLTAVPPLYRQLVQLDWPAGVGQSLRYFASTGGPMPRDTLNRLRLRLPQARPYLMYGLTEAFRSTCLPPEEVDRRPDSIGRAIANVEILVLRPDGSHCDPDEPGELVHRGALVGLGYWNDAQRTAERYKPLAAWQGGRQLGLQLPEYAVFSGDTVRMDADGFLYFIGRQDDMLKVSGYRVSPTEIEEVLYGAPGVRECAVFGSDHPGPEVAIQAVAVSAGGISAAALKDIYLECRTRLPAYMVPAAIEIVPGPLPRSPNGKIDRQLLARQWRERQRLRPPAGSAPQPQP